MLVLDPCLNETCYSPLTSRVSTLARGGADCSMWTVLTYTFDNFSWLAYICR